MAGAPVICCGDWILLARRVHAHDIASPARVWLGSRISQPRFILSRALQVFNVHLAAHAAGGHGRRPHGNGRLGAAALHRMRGAFETLIRGTPQQFEALEALDDNVDTWHAAVVTCLGRLVREAQAAPNAKDRSDSKAAANATSQASSYGRKLPRERFG